MVLMTTGRFFCGLGSVAVLGIGTGAWLWPAKSTRTYGIPNDDPDAHAFIRGMAARDLTMGLFMMWATIADDRPAMKWGLLACALAPLADYYVAHERRGMIPQLITHGSGVLGVLATYAILVAEDR
jgi:hypothetical protein